MFLRSGSSRKRVGHESYMLVPHPAVNPRLAVWAVENEKRTPPQNAILGFFYDRKEGHYVVAKARRDVAVKKLFMDNKLRSEGFNAPVPPADLVALRLATKAMASGTFHVISSVVVDAVPYVVLPEPATLAFSCGEALKKRIDALRAELPPPPAAKRPRVGTCAQGSGEPAAPDKLAIEKLL